MKIPKLLICAVAVCLWAARPGDFQIVGPGGGGAMFNPTVSPHDENTVLVSCDMTGAYITHDAGRSWRMFNLRGTVRFFVFDPVDPKTIYAQVTGLWRSIDSGETWKLVYPKPSTIKGIRMDSDHADEKLVADPDPLGEITALAIDPSDSRILYAAAGHGKQASLFESRDRGETWVRRSSLAEPSLRIWIDPQSPSAARNVYIAGAHSIQLATPAGVQDLTAPDTAGLTDVSAGFDGHGQSAFYAVSENGAFVSTNGAKTWNRCKLPGNPGHVRAIATSLRNPRTAYLSYNKLQLDGNTWSGVAKTMDEGQTWTLVWKEERTAAPNVHDAWITDSLGAGWAESPVRLGVADQSPNLSYGTDFGRTMQTTDGGRTWNAVYSRKVKGGDWTSTGLDVTTNYGVHFDPFDQKRRFITYTDIGLFRSEDAGRSWLSSTNGVPRRWRNTTYWVTFDPEIKGRMWSVNSYTHDLPRPKMWRHNSPESYKGGVCRSDDGGRTWIESNEGMPETAATHILLDPKSPATARTLYVTGFGRGVFKSTDGGKSWALKNNGITQNEPFAWRLTLASDGALYVVVARRSDDGSIGNAGDGALYKSTDGAETWQPVSLPSGVNGPNGLAVDPKSPQRLYLAAWARASGMHGEDGGIYLSENGGHTWRCVLDRDQHVYDVTIDPRNPASLYAAGFESSAWHSTDRGEHWTRIPGFNFKWGHRVVLDPEDPDKIYVTTFGGSVWHGRVDGQPAVLDVATPQLTPGSR